MHPCPRWVALLVGVLSCTQKFVGLIPGQGTYLGCEFGPFLGHVWEAMDQCFFLTMMFLSLSFSLPFLLKSIIKTKTHIFGGGLKKYISIPTFIAGVIYNSQDLKAAQVPMSR